MKFRKKPVVIEAVQLRWDTWNEMCKFIGVKPFEHGVHGCYVDENGKVTSDTNGRIGLKIPTLEGVMLAVEGDWIIRGVQGEFYPCKPDIFEMTYEQVDARSSVDFVPHWSKYPKLASIFSYRPKENVYWEELRALLVEARADAVQYIRDVRADELRKAREG